MLFPADSHNRCEISWNFLSDCLQISITILSKFERINCLISPLKWSENPWIFRNFQEISWIWVVIICRKKHVQNTRLVTFQSQKLWHKSNDLGLYVSKFIVCLQIAIYIVSASFIKFINILLFPFMSNLSHSNDHSS